MSTRIFALIMLAVFCIAGVRAAKSDTIDVIAAIDAAQLICDWRCMDQPKDIEHALAAAFLLRQCKTMGVERNDCVNYARIFRGTYDVMPESMR